MFVPAALIAGAMLSMPAVASAAKPGDKASSPSPTNTGNDISWPQCSKLGSLPTNQAFGIVGVNNGTPNTTNPCLTSELTWANKSSGTGGQPRAAIYVNTANPGDVTPAVADWPTSNSDATNAYASDNDPYGACNGADDTACSWQYGYNMANLDANTRGIPAPFIYRWYLDVESANSWTRSTARNAADLEGMVAYFRNIDATVGLYSTAQQWKTIVGSYGGAMDAGGNTLNGLISWLPGASNESAANTNCKLSPLTKGGRVSLTQYVQSKPNLDFDISCP